MDKAKKKATIFISLVPEADLTDNKEIEKQIREESSIPFCAEIEKVTIEEIENPYKQLRGHGRNISLKYFTKLFHFSIRKFLYLESEQGELW